MIRDIILFLSYNCLLRIIISLICRKEEETPRGAAKCCFTVGGRQLLTHLLAEKPITKLPAASNFYCRSRRRTHAAKAPPSYTRSYLNPKYLVDVQIPTPNHTCSQPPEFHLTSTVVATNFLQRPSHERRQTTPTLATSEPSRRKTDFTLIS